jgi:hypothetical protein
VRPKRHRYETSSRLGGLCGADELGVSSVDTIEVADHYNGRSAHPMRLLPVLLATSNS